MKRKVRPRILGPRDYFSRLFEIFGWTPLSFVLSCLLKGVAPESRMVITRLILYLQLFEQEEELFYEETGADSALGNSLGGKTETLAMCWRSNGHLSIFSTQTSQQARCLQGKMMAFTSFSIQTKHLDRSCCC